MSSDLAWAGIAVGAVGFEMVQWWRSRDGVDRGTLSRAVRRLFHVKLLWGRWLFVSAWAGFATWVGWHIIVRRPREATL